MDKQLSTPIDPLMDTSTATTTTGTGDACIDGVPLPIIRLNRVVIVSGVLIAFLTQQPLVLTALLALILPAALLGRRASLIFKVGRVLFVRQNAVAPKEDARTQRFNNIIAATCLVIANLAFVLGVPVVGWVFAFAVALAATVALLGFCVGCFVFYQFKLNKRRLLAALN